MSDSKRNYEAGIWGGGDLDVEGLAKKYGLDRSKEGKGEGHIWGKTKSGEKVYLGKSSMDMASNSDLIEAHSRQAGEEVDHKKKGNDLSSMGDIKGAILAEWDGSGGAAKEETKGPEEPDAPVSVSPKLAEARTRVKQYEEDVLSGRGVYGKKSFEQTESGNSFLDRYKLKLQEDYKQNPQGDYVATGDQERYDNDMEEYNRKKAEYDAQSSSLGN